MKSKIAGLILFVAIAFICNAELKAQYKAQILETVSSDYPIMTTYFYLRNAANEAVITSFPNFKNDISVTEKVGGVDVPRKVLEGECNPGVNSFSAIVVVDVSGSMGDGIDTLPDGKPDPNGQPKKIDVVREALIDFLNNLDTNRTEVCLIFFGNTSQRAMTFTNRKDTLRKIINTLDMSKPSGGTNFNAAFLRLKENVYDSTHSALYFCKKRDFDNPKNPEVAKYKPVIIFLTDGNNRAVDDMGRPYDGAAVVRLAQERNAHCYVIQFGSVPVDPINRPYLQALASIELKPGETFADNMWLNVMSRNELIDVYGTIMNKASSLGDPAPCSIKWVTDCSGGDATFTFNTYGGAFKNSKYTINPGVMPYLEITAPAQAKPFVDIRPNSQIANINSVNITARNNYVDFSVVGNDLTSVVSGIRTFNPIKGQPKYRIKKWDGFDPANPRLNKDETRQVYLEYEPSDSLFSEADISINSTACGNKTFRVSGEMKPVVDSVHMGNVSIGAFRDSVLSMVFCNKTGGSIHVNKIVLSGTYKDDFKVLDPLGAFDLDSAQCKEIKYHFEPTGTPGFKIADVEFQTDYLRPAYGITGKIKGVVTGNGIGGKAISATHFYDTASCTKPEVLDTIYLQNDGNLDINLSLTGIDGTDKGDFSITNLPLPTVIKPGPANRVPVVIKFKPTVFTNAPKDAYLEVVSDAENTPFKYNLVGYMENIDYTMTAPITFGEVCVGVPSTKQFTLKNTGNKTATFNLTPPAQFTVSQPSVANLSPNGEAIIDVTFNPTADGPTGALNLVGSSVPCAKIVNLSINGVGVLPTYDFTPKVSGAPKVDVSATIGNSTPVNCTITNKSASNLTITDIQAADTRFVVTNPVPAFGTPILPNATCTFVVTYKPVAGDAGILSSKLNITASTCNHASAIDLIGNPGLAKADIVVDELTGFDGETKDFGIHLRNKSNFDKSNTTLISTKITYNNTLLELAQVLPTTVNGDSTTVDLNAIPVLAVNADQNNIATLKMKVKQTGTLNQTVLRVHSTKADNGGANFVPDNGLFTLNPATALISIDSLQEFAGKTAYINIYMRNALNITDFNQNILLNLVFGGMILDPPLNNPIVKSSKFDVPSQEWTISLELPVKTSGANNDILATLPFKVMLGTEAFTTIRIDSPKVKVGSANLKTKDGYFALAYVCKDGNSDSPRLFNPFGQAQLIAIKPNPPDGSATIEYETIEEGSTKIWISDMLGNNVNTVINSNHKPGTHSVGFETWNLNSGVYFIMMQTPTQLMKEKLYIVK